MRRSAALTRVGCTTLTTCDWLRSVRKAEVTTAPSELSFAGLRKSPTRIDSRSLIRPAATSEPAGPIPIARITSQPIVSTPNTPSAPTPPIAVRRQVNTRRAPLIPGGRPLVAARCWTAPVISTIGSPSAITIAAPGSTQSGTPIVCTSSAAKATMITLAMVYAASARPKWMRPFLGARKARVAAVIAAALLPLGVASDSSERSSSSAVCGRSAGCFSRQRMMSAASAGGIDGRSCCTGSGVCIVCAASTCCGERPGRAGGR